MKRHAILIGGGPNGLTAAATMANSGWAVTLLERRPTLGGLAEPIEFHPGFFAPGPLDETSRFSPSVARALQLDRHGLSYRAGGQGVLLSHLDGPSISIDEAEEAATRASIEAGGETGRADAQAWTDWRALLGRLSPPVARIFTESLPTTDPAGAGDWMELIAHALRLRRLADRDLLELLRLIPLPVADWMDDTFANPLLQAGLAYDGVVHTFLGPRSAGSSATLLIKAATTNAAVQGGPGALLAALTSAARAAGVDLRTNAEATRVQVEEGRVTAVELGDGSTLPAEAVLFACHPRVGLFDLVEPRQLDPQLAHDLEHHRSRGTTALLHLALDKLPAALSETLRTPNGAGPITRLRTSPSLEHLELAFNGIRYGELPEHPALEVTIPTLRDERTPDGAPLAPAGSHVLTIRASFVPSSGWTPALRDELQTSLLAELAPHIPDLGSNTLAAHLVTPADLERDFNLPGGDIHHGEHALDQFMGLRPAPGHARHTLPIRGLFLASGGTHPGGGLTGSPGHLAARAALG